jgi:WD40 repeat protein
VLKIFHKNASACAWSPDGKSFALNGTDRGESITLWSTDPSRKISTVTPTRVWPAIADVSGMSFTPDGDYLVVAGPRAVQFLSMAIAGATGTVALEESSTISSFHMSRDGREVLLSMACNELHLWDLESRQLLSTYDGYNQDLRFVIGSCLGGFDDDLVLSGSDNGIVHVWNKRSSKKITTAKGHTGTINAVAWSPTNTGLFVSASDDHSIHLWAIQPTLA